MRPVRRPPACLLVLSALIAASLPAAPRHHFVPPQFLSLQLELPRPLELGRRGPALLRCASSLNRPVRVTFELDLPEGLHAVSAGFPRVQSIAAGSSVTVAVELEATAPIGGKSLAATASCSYPLDELKRHFLARVPLYSARARSEFGRLAQNPPERFRVVASVAVRVGPHEGRIGLDPPFGVHLPFDSPLVAIPALHRESAAARNADWKTLLEQLRAGTLPAPDGWRRLHAAAIVLLREGRVSSASAVWRKMLDRAAAAPADMRPVLRASLGAALFLAGELREARRVLEPRAEEERSPYGLFTLASVHLRLDDPRRASSCLREAVTLHTGYTLARARLLELESGGRR